MVAQSPNEESKETDLMGLIHAESDILMELLQAYKNPTQHEAGTLRARIAKTHKNLEFLLSKAASLPAKNINDVIDKLASLELELKLTIDSQNMDAEQRCLAYVKAIKEFLRAI